MSAEKVTDLQAARAERSARERAYIEKLITDRGDVLMEWLFALTPEKRGDIAEMLASEIVNRYAPIAKQFRALYDVLALYVAGAQERGEDLNIAVLKGLTVMMADERYIGLARHIVREQAMTDMKFDPVAALEHRRKHPTPVDEVCSGLFDHYAGLRKS